MERALISCGLVLGSFAGMEAIAWLAHKYLMHGLLWPLHCDHHNKEGGGFFERNDFFFLIFAMPGIVCLAAGSYNHIGPVVWIGAGITLYGCCYFLVHDLLIHQRFRIFRNSRHWYLRALRRAHKMHHRHLGREDGECFGMLWVPPKYFAESRKEAGA